MSKKLILVTLVLLLIVTGLVIAIVVRDRQSHSTSSTTLPSSTAPTQITLIGTVSIQGKPRGHVKVYLLPRMVSAAEFNEARDELVEIINKQLPQMKRAADTENPSLAGGWNIRLQEYENKLNQITQPIEADPQGLVDVRDAYARLHFRSGFGLIFSKEVISTSLTSETGSFVFESKLHGECFLAAEARAENVLYSWLIAIPIATTPLDIKLSEANSIIAWKKE